MDEKKIEILKEIAKGAGDILLRYRKQGFSIQTKKDKFDFVTDADKASDAFLTDRLTILFPGDKILIEESANSLPDFSGRVWMVDPLDGTKHYIVNEDGFSVLIGLAVDGIPTVGVIYAPVRDTFYWASVGMGAWKQVGTNEPTRLQVSSVNNLEDVSLVLRYRRGEKRATDAIEDNMPVKNRIFEGSLGLKIAKIAEGTADAGYNLSTHANKWDYCGPEIILREAGGIITDCRGKNLNYLLPSHEFATMTVVSNRILHIDLLKQVEGLL